MGQRVDYSLWAMLEIMTAIMCANLPALPALYRYFVTKSKGASDHSSGLNTRPEISSSGLRKRISQSVHSVFSSVRESKSRFSSQRSLAKDGNCRFKATDVEIPSPRADPSLKARSVGDYGYEKFDFSMNGVSREATFKDPNIHTLSSTPTRPSVESFTWNPVPAPERHIYRTDEISVKSSAD